MKDNEHAETDQCRHCGHTRPLDVSTLKSARQKFYDMKVTGPKENYFKPIFRMSSYSQDYRRSFDALAIPGGGIIIQSCWFEKGRLALSMSYEPDLVLMETRYEDENGETIIGYTPVHKDYIRAISANGHGNAHSGHREPVTEFPVAKTAPQPHGRSEGEDGKGYGMQCLKVNEMNVYSAK